VGTGADVVTPFLVGLAALMVASVGYSIIAEEIKQRRRDR
jgi:hypothetical protein